MRLLHKFSHFIRSSRAIFSPPGIRVISSLVMLRSTMQSLVRLEDLPREEAPEDMLTRLVVIAWDYKAALEALTRLSDLELDRVHYRPKDLNKKIKKIL